MDYDSNPYYNPAAIGCEIVASVDIADSWEFDIALVIRELSTGKLYFASDSGCSCPTPFEDHTFPGERWTEITSQREIIARLNEFSSDDSYRNLPGADRQDFVAKVSKALAEQGTRIKVIGTLPVPAGGDD